MKFPRLAMLAFACFLLGAASVAKAAGKAAISYETLGTGDEHVLVMHDWLGDRTNYTPALPYLDTKRFTYAFVDLRGYGESRDLKGRFTADEAAADAVSVADALGWSKFHIVGHSMTGMVVQRIALNVPDRIKSVVATTPVAASGMQIDEGTWNFFKAVVTDTESAGKAIGLLTGGRLSPAWTDFKVRRAMGTSTAKARLAYLHMFVKHNFSKDAEQAGLNIPFLLILGENDIDAFKPAAVKETFQKWYKNVEIVNVANAGHYPMQETPAFYAATLEGFLAKHTGG